MNRAQTLSPLWWLYVPVLMILVQIGLEISYPSHVLARMHSEGGPHETFEALFVGSAFLIAVATLFNINWKTRKWLGYWIALAAVCCFYVTGEEISWGQHLLSWSTPEFWSRINDQNETNLHNTSDWLDQKPRLLLFIGIMVGGIIVPALRRWKPSALPQKFSLIYPANYMLVTALGVLVPYLVQHMGKFFFGLHLFERVSEVQEVYMYYFVLLYLVGLRKIVISKE